MTAWIRFQRPKVQAWCQDGMYRIGFALFLFVMARMALLTTTGNGNTGRDGSFGGGPTTTTTPRVSRRVSSFGTLVEEVDSPRQWIDFFIVALIVGFGALQFIYAQPGTEFFRDDVFYADSARALAQHGFYGINGYPETNMPPGVSALLALLCLAGGYSHLAFVRAMVVVGTLGFIVSYELLRRQVPRAVAAAICLLLISSKIYFAGVTQYVASCYPYFFSAISALWVARKFEGTSGLTARLGWGALLTVLIVASLMFASAGIAFLGAIVASTGILFLRNRPLALSRVKLYFTVLLLGLAVQGVWMTRAPAEASAGISAREWPVLGFPHSYLSQFKIKSGNCPEQGLATPSDVLQRVLENSYQYSNLLGRFLFIRWNSPSWITMVALGVLLLTVAGWGYSMWLTGGNLQDWYFAGYAFIFLAWPWNLEMRFLLPVAPLAALYLWRGGALMVLLAKNRPRTLAAALLSVATLLTASAWLWMHGARITAHLPHAHLPKLFLLMGLFAGVLATGLVWAAHFRPRSIPPLLSWLARSSSVSGISPVQAFELLALVALTGLTVQGLTAQLGIGRANRDPHALVNSPRSDAEAGAWVCSHTDTNAVIMARLVPTVCHHANRKVIWFPPSSNPHLLLDGMLKHKINFVIVVRRDDSYYLPSDEDCFAPLLSAYPADFRLVYHTPEVRIFEMVPNHLVAHTGNDARSALNGKFH